MRLAVVSDSHHDARCMKKLLAALPKVDGLCFLGDCSSDGAALRDGLAGLQPEAAFYAVAGNNDLSSRDPREVVLPVGGRRILLTHGHSFRVKYQLDLLTYRALEIQACAALFGHTHCSHVEYAHGVLLLNPGALCNGSYALLEVRPDGLTPRLMTL